MHDRPSASWKATANTLAGLIYEGCTDPGIIDTLLEQFRHRNEPVTEAGRKQPPYKYNGSQKLRPDSIGIWKKQIRNEETVYERDPALNKEWHLWANKHRIYHRKYRRRIVLLGESVARGYFYDPYYTVAQELEGVVNNLFKSDYCEVVDLARTSIRMEELLELTGSCLPLEPDVIVVFAGNNWVNDLRGSLTTADYASMYEIFLTQSFPGLNAFLESRFKSIISSFIREMKRLSHNARVPLVFVVPGFNLKDWKSDEPGKNLPWLPANALSEWLEARTHAEAAKNEKQYELFRQAARGMIEIDAFNPLGFELLAEYHMGRGEWTEALRCLEGGRDAVLVSRGGNEHPRCFGVIRQAILAEASSLDITVVDLPAVFNDLMRGKAPDRSLFLDYCHMTIQGIKVSIKHTAAALLRYISTREVFAWEVENSGIVPDEEVMSVAHFCAAIHNAHSGQPADILLHHCREAVRYSPNIKASMLEYIDFTNRSAPAALCKSFESIIREGKMRQYEGGMALRPLKDRKLLDIALVDAMAEALIFVEPDAAGRIRLLRKQEHAIGHEKVSLLESTYSMKSCRDLAVEPGPAYLQSRSAKCEFSFIADRRYPLAFELVYRTPRGHSQDQFAKILLNDEDCSASRTPMSSTWRTFSFIVEPGFLREGVNKLTIQWPYIFQPLEKQGVIDSFGGFVYATLPVLGEIHMLTAVRH